MENEVPPIVNYLTDQAQQPYTEIPMGDIPQYSRDILQPFLYEYARSPPHREFIEFVECYQYATGLQGSITAAVAYFLFVRSGNLLDSFQYIPQDNLLIASRKAPLGTEKHYVIIRKCQAVKRQLQKLPIGCQEYHTLKDQYLLLRQYEDQARKREGIEHPKVEFDSDGRMAGL